MTAIWDPQSYAFNAYFVPVCLTANAILLLGGHVLLLDIRSHVNRLFSLATLTIGLWLLAFSFLYCATRDDVALWWAKAAYAGVPFIPPAVYHFTLAVLDREAAHRHHIALAWLTSAGFAAFIMTTDWLIGSVAHFWWGPYPQYGWLSLPYLTYFFGLMIAAFRHYVTAAKAAVPGTTQHARIKGLMTAFAVIYLGSFDYLAKFGVPLYPFGYLPVGAFVVLAAITIRRYTLVDITPAFAAPTIIDTMNDALIVLDHDRCVQLLNPAACALLERSANQLLRRPLAEVLPHPVLPERLDALKRDGSSEVAEITYQSPAGRQYALSVSASIITDRKGRPAAFVCVVRDHTHAKSIADALTQRALQLTEAQAIAQLGSWEWDLATQRMTWSKELYRIYRLPRDHEPTYATFLEGIHPADRAWVQATLDEALRSHHTFQMDYRMLRPDGTVRLLRAQGRVLLDALGQPVKLLGVGQDITESKYAEAELRRSEEAYRNLFNSIRDGLLMVDPERRILDANPAFLDQFGYALDEIRGRGTDLLYARQDEFKKIGQLLPREAGQAQSSAQVEFKRKSGDTFPGEVTIYPMKNAAGQVTGFIGFVKDLTDRKVVETRLKESEERFQMIFRYSNELEEQNRERSLIIQMGEALQTCYTPDEAYAVLGGFLPQLFVGFPGALYLISPSGHNVEAATAWDLPPTEQQVFAKEACWALRHCQTHLIEDTRHGLLCRHLPQPLPVGYVCAPIMANGEVIGVLHVRQPRADELSESKRRLAVSIAQRIALTLVNLRLHQALRDQSIRDPLTQLLNRRYLEEALEREVRRAARSQRPLGVLMLDLDYFKRVNDTYGHDAGDTVLRDLAKLLQSHVREEDIVCRYGGEEFTFILPETTLEAAVQRAEDLLARLRHLHMTHQGKLLGPLTISCGVAVMPQHGTTADALIQAADAALYQAKQNGRNQVVVGGQALRAPDTSAS